ncbi:uncharacterized protein LOC135338965 [Halichondria panicea]|uniref:uncharacterized protein LOC135338965 n=1 Tax=Halichondria panicea TaxID=6063 RepID=UPI00312B73A0
MTTVVEGSITEEKILYDLTVPFCPSRCGGIHRPSREGRRTCYNTRINIIVAILPKNIQSKANRFAFTDPDTSSNVTLLINTSKNNYFRLKQNLSENTAILLSNEKISAAETNDVISLQIALSDEPNEQNPIIRNITVYFTDTVPVTPSIGPLTPTVPFFQSEIGIAVIVVIWMLILALLSIFLCMCCYCYLRLRREKDPLRNVDRMITAAQRLNTETDRKGKKSYGRPMNYFGYSDLDPLDFPEYSTQDPDTNLLYSPNINGEFESSFMGEDYDTEMAEDLVDQFDPSTDTSVLSSFPMEDKTAILVVGT